MPIFPAFNPANGASGGSPPIPPPLPPLYPPATPQPQQLVAGSTSLGTTLIGSWSASVTVAAAVSTSNGSPPPSVSISGSGAGPYSISIASGLANGVVYAVTLTGTDAFGQTAEVVLGVGVAVPASGMPPWEPLVHIKFKSQTPRDYTNLAAPVSFTLIDESGRNISGEISRTVTNSGASRQGWDASRGFYTELIATATDSSARIAVPFSFAPGVALGMFDDVRITVVGKINLPAGNNNCYWLPCTHGVLSESVGSYGLRALRGSTNLNSTLTFRANSTSSSFINEAAGFPTNSFTDFSEVEMVMFWPRWSTRPYSTYRKVGDSTYWQAYMGQEIISPSFVISNSSGNSSIPYIWQNKSSFWLLHSIYNGSGNGLDQQFSHIYEIKLERRALV